MKSRKEVLTISGSTRQRSTNLNLLKAIEALFEAEFEFLYFNGLSALPHFNPDDDNENPPPAITVFRKMIKKADGILICTPEYAMGLPGTLKNALDWTVSSSDFSQKPVAVITAATSGEKAHESLIGTLNIIEAVTNKDIQLLIPFAKAKINTSKVITDENTLADVKKLMNNFLELLNNKN